MNTIINSLRTGNAKERLAIVADLLSVIGVSVASVVGGILTLPSGMRIDDVLGIGIGALFGLTITCLVLLAFLFASSLVTSKQYANPFYKTLMLIALWSLFGVLLVYAIGFSYVVLSSIHFRR